MKFTCSLKNNRDFRIVYNNGKSFANKYAVAFVLKNNLEHNRLGVSVSKKVGNSVIRNKIKRLFKENYRLLEYSLKSGFDIVIIARKPMSDANFYDAKASLSFLLTKLALVSSI